jgi:hypothetical protein
LDTSRIIIHQCLSNDLILKKDEKFRFIHIDGGHSSKQVYFDLSLSKTHLIEKGIIAIDDYKHRDFPVVTQGVEKFLSKNYNLEILADLNRHGAIGRKFYLMKTKSA